MSLYPPFPQALPMSTSRKPIVDAAWIARGGAVLALLADGQWGIWDVDGSTPSSGTRGGNQSLFGKHSSGLRGAGLTSFSASGYLEGTSPLRNPGSQKATPAGTSSGEFVPMTPHTRRETLATVVSGGIGKLAAVRGGIEVLHCQPLRATGTAATDESAVLWMGATDPIVVVIPAVAKFWDAQLRRGAGGGVNLFSGAQPTRMIRLADLNAGLRGERCTGVAAIPRPGRQQAGGDSTAASDGAFTPTGENSTAEGLPIDVLVQGESRLVVVRESDDAPPAANRLLATRRKPRVGVRSASAIIAYPRPEKPSSVAFNLSVSRPGGSLRALPQRPATAGLFESQSRPDILPSTEAEGPEDFGRPSSSGLNPSQRSADSGFAFSQSLFVAANATDDEEEAEERNVEDEILDIMEIDRELEEMETERHSGRKHVFFEEE